MLTWSVETPIITGAHQPLYDVSSTSIPMVGETHAHVQALAKGVRNRVITVFELPDHQIASA